MKCHAKVHLQSSEGSTQLHVVVGSIFVVTVAIEYARTGRPNPFGENFLTNTTLALAGLAFVVSVINFVRMGSASSIATALLFCALYLYQLLASASGAVLWVRNCLAGLSCVRIWLLVTRCIDGRDDACEGILPAGHLRDRPFCKCINIWLGLVLSLSFAMLAVGNDAFH
jgi:hypothetical protein